MINNKVGISAIALATIMGLGIVAIQSSYASHFSVILERKAPVDISGNNIYVAWTTNKTGHDEVMFRVSTDAGKTFSDKIKLSDSPDADSVNVELGEDEGKVAVSWWEHNLTSIQPVMKVSTDNGKSFGEKIMLSSNGPIG
jgi:hypothetical protein